MSDEAHPGQHAASGADNPWAPPEEKVRLDKPTGAQPQTGEPPVGGPPPSFGGTTPAAGGFGPPAGVGQGAFIPPPPLAPSDPGAFPYSAPGGYGSPVHPGYPGYGWPGMPMPPRNGFGIAALVLGILSVCLFCMYGLPAVILGTLAVVFGVKGRRLADKGEADNRGQAQAGFVLGIIGIVIGVAVITVLIVAIVAAIRDDSRHSDPPDVRNALGISAPVLAHD